ncbi:Phosphoglycerate mutase-like protein AT74 [Glycine soja]
MKKRILMRHEESLGNRNTTAYTTISDHNIQSTTQGMIQTLHVSEHLHYVIGNDRCSHDWRVQFYVFPYAYIRSMLRELRWCFLKKWIISLREE